MMLAFKAYFLDISLPDDISESAFIRAVNMLAYRFNTLKYIFYPALL